MTHFDPQDVSDFWDVRELVDADDPMEVGLSGPCSIDGMSVNPVSGVCSNGHDDLDRAADGTGTARDWFRVTPAETEAAGRLMDAGAAGVDPETGEPTR
jgi:hypothetical protein